MKRVEQDQVVETLARDELVAAQTPQAFRRAGPPRARSPVTFPLQATARRSWRREAGAIKIVEGDRRLLKVTDAEDLALVESWLE